MTSNKNTRTGEPCSIATPPFARGVDRNPYRSPVRNPYRSPHRSGGTRLATSRPSAVACMHSPVGAWLWRSLLALSFAALALSSFQAHAENQVGLKLDKIQLPDQHDQQMTISENTKAIVFARDMESNQIVTKAFEGLKAEQLSAKGIVYLADISGMPSLVAKMFALPRMRKYPYSVLLAREPRASSNFPFKAKQVTFIRLQSLTISKIEYFESSDGLRKALDE